MFYHVASPETGRCDSLTIASGNFGCMRNGAAYEMLKFLDSRKCVCKFVYCFNKCQHSEIASN